MSMSGAASLCCFLPGTEVIASLPYLGPETVCDIQDGSERILKECMLKDFKVRFVSSFVVITLWSSPLQIHMHSDAKCSLPLLLLYAIGIMTGTKLLRCHTEMIPWTGRNRISLRALRTAPSPWTSDNESALTFHISIFNPCRMASR
ncbi:hypothetical protein K443DRAFT_444693 [Laccaria amethystina LaAM-08-1]|uniref:Uncharacterized protein n=1 Tax=Laccaria amethystina LaAM-08-1 TaxID=1095629 RepID=A0A0C9X705_9AGAR|nr:hypothetical protein K443DRAFT_444693 [Laccaria amethystina LaAM-08-1]